jgi:hypothetical protein
MEENSEYTVEFFPVRLQVVNMMDDSELRHKFENLYPMDPVVKAATQRKKNINKLNRNRNELP